LAIAEDFKLLIFSEHLTLLKILGVKVRLAHFAYFVDSQSKLITGGIDGCFIINFTMKSKYNPKQALSLDPEGKNMEFNVSTKVIYLLKKG
jgi:hypothetical protein